MRYSSFYDPGRRMSAWLLAAIVLLAALLRLPDLGVQSLWYDESATWSQVNGSLADLFVRTAADNYPPLYNILAWISVAVFGDAEWVLRLPSALLGIGNVPLIYLLASRIGGRTAGLLAAALLALSAFHIWYSQEARMYALLAFTATAHGWAVLELTRQAKVAVRVLVVISGVALVYSHPFGALTVAGIALGGMVVLRHDWRRLLELLLLECAVALAFLPWALVLLGRAQVIAEGGFWIKQATPAHIWTVVHELTSMLIIPFIAAGLLLLRRTDAAREARRAAPLLLVWAVLPLIIAIVASYLVQPVLLDRYLAGVLPPILVLASCGLALVIRDHRQFAAGIAMVSLLAGLGVVFASPGERENWRSAIAQLERAIRPGDCITMPISMRPVVDYYLRPAWQCLLPLANDTPPPAGRLFVVQSPQINGRRVNEAIAAQAPAMAPVEETTIGRVTIYVLDHLTAATEGGPAS